MLGLRHLAATPRDNGLLARLPASDWERIRPGMDVVELDLDEALYESDETLEYVYFPTTAIVSLRHVMSGAASTEIAMVGNEGLVGVSLFMGGGTALSRAVVQSAGWAYRIHADWLTEEFRKAGALQHLVLRYTQLMVTQVAQMAVCNRHHSIDQQLCRWLLLSLDRLPWAAVTITHERLASALGVRREGVTAAAGSLQRLGFIRYRRGRITVLDRAGLMARSCECYAVVKRESDRLLGRYGRALQHVPLPPRMVRPDLESSWGARASKAAPAPRAAFGVPP